ncbi:MAG: hypothetical protein Q9213_002482 [Squamulea squamosa]
MEDSVDGRKCARGMLRISSLGVCATASVESWPFHSGGLQISSFEIKNANVQVVLKKATEGSGAYGLFCVRGEVELAETAVKAILQAVRINNWWRLVVSGQIDTLLALSDSELELKKATLVVSNNDLASAAVTRDLESFPISRGVFFCTAFESVPLIEETPQRTDGAVKDIQENGTSAADGTQPPMKGSLTRHQMVLSSASRHLIHAGLPMESKLNLGSVKDLMLKIAVDFRETIAFFSGTVGVALPKTKKRNFDLIIGVTTVEGQLALEINGAFDNSLGLSNRLALGMFKNLPLPPPEVQLTGTAPWNGKTAMIDATINLLDGLKFIALLPTFQMGPLDVKGQLTHGKWPGQKFAGFLKEINLAKQSCIVNGEMNIFDSTVKCDTHIEYKPVQTMKANVTTMPKLATPIIHCKMKQEDIDQLHSCIKYLELEKDVQELEEKAAVILKRLQDDLAKLGVQLQQEKSAIEDKTKDRDGREAQAQCTDTETVQSSHKADKERALRDAQTGKLKKQSEYMITDVVKNFVRYYPSFQPFMSIPAGAAKIGIAAIKEIIESLKIDRYKHLANALSNADLQVSSGLKALESVPFVSDTDSNLREIASSPSVLVSLSTLPEKALAQERARFTHLAAIKSLLVVAEDTSASMMQMLTDYFKRGGDDIVLGKVWLDGKNEL